jgi:phthalate 4,5-cis-dihydrodiol dehydrogenase
MYGVGIVGLGRVSRGHARALQEAKGARLVAACDLDEGRVERFTSQYGCAGEKSLDALLARPDVDAVLIALPHVLHEEATAAAARAGKHVMVEKPMAMDLGACDRMIAAAKEGGVQLFVAHTERGWGRRCWRRTSGISPSGARRVSRGCSTGPGGAASSRWPGRT